MAKQNDKKIRSVLISLAAVVILVACVLIIVAMNGGGDTSLFDDTMRTEHSGLRYQYSTLQSEEELEAEVGSPQYERVCNLFEELNQAGSPAQDHIGPNDGGASISLEFVGEDPVLYQFYDLGIEKTGGNSDEARFWTIDWASTEWNDSDHFINDVKEALRSG